MVIESSIDGHPIPVLTGGKMIGGLFAGPSGKQLECDPYAPAY
jgi:hypothetical protein